MDLLITDANAIRVLSRIFQLCTKVSETLQIQHAAPNITIRCITQASSTHLTFILPPQIFPTYTPPTRPLILSTRPIATILRSPQQITSCRITGDSRTYVTFTLLSRTRTKKTFRLAFVENRVPNVRCAPGPSGFETSPRFLLDLLANFHAKLEEITLIPSRTTLTMSSFADDGPSNVSLRTEMNVPAQELESYTFVADTSLTLVCKPLRAILEFGDACDVGVSLRYAEGGKPVIVQLHDEGLFVARCVFATRVTEDAPAPAVDGAAVVTGVGRRKGRLQTQAETPGMQLDATHGRTQGRSQGRTQGHTQGHARTQSERQPTSSPLASHVYEESPSSYGQPVRQTDRYAGRDYLQVAHEADDDERNPYGDSGDMEDDDDDDDFVEGTPPPAS